MWPVIVLLAGPVLAGLLSLVIQRARLLHAVNFTTMLGLAVAETFLTKRVLAEGSVTTLGSLVYIDALSDFILIIITAIGLSCSLYMWSYMDEQVARAVIAPKHLGVFFFLFHMFLFAMVAATMANSATSALRITSIARTNGLTMVTWQALPNGLYRMTEAVTPTGTWSDVAGTLLSTNVSASLPESTGTTTSVYRVELLY